MAQRYDLVETDDSRVIDGQKVVVESKGYSNLTLEEAEKIAQQDRGAYNWRIVPHNPDRPDEKVMGTRRSSSPRERGELDKLAQQAKDKSDRGEPISQKEREAYRLVTRGDKLPPNPPRKDIVSKPEFEDIKRKERERRIEETTKKIIARRQETTPQQTISTETYTREYQQPQESRYAGGTITKADKPKGILSRIRRKAEEFEYDATVDTTPKRIVTRIGAFGLAATASAAYVVRHPIKSIKGTYYAITHPSETGAALGEGLKQRPATTAGEIAGPIILGKVTKVGIKKVKVAKAKITPVDVDIAAKKVQFKAVTSPKQSKVIVTEPIEFAAKVGKKKYVGVGAGKVAVTPKGKVGGILKFQVTPEKAKKPFSTEVAFKTVATKNKGVVKGISISKSVTTIDKKVVKQRTITPHKSKTVIGGDYPRTITKSGYLGKGTKGKVAAKSGTVTITRKVGTVKQKGQPTIEYYDVLEKQMGTKKLSKYYPKSQSIIKSRKAQLIGRQLIKRERVIEPETSFGADIYRGIRKSVRGAEIASIGEVRAPIIPIYTPAIYRDTRIDRRVRQPARIQPKVKYNVISRPKPIIKQPQASTPRTQYKPKSEPIQEVQPKPTVIPRISTQQKQEPKPIQDYGLRFFTPTPTPSPIIPPPTILPKPKTPAYIPKYTYTPKKTKKSKRRSILPRGFKGTPSLPVITGAVKGYKLTPEQRKGKAFISPFQIRAL